VTSHDDLGRRIGRYRAKVGMTQQELADRVAISRTAVSHLEAGMTVPGERTVVLLAGVFKIEPRELVAGTGYPLAKAERLPAVAMRYTELELFDALLARDIEWLARVDEPRLLDEWEARLAAVDAGALDLRERELLRDLQRRVRTARG